MADVKTSNVWGINEKNELVAVSGTGTTTVTGFLNESNIPVDENGRMVIAGLGAATAYTPPISQYDKALIFNLPRQANAVKGLSRNINDAQYVGAITDAEVYDTFAGGLSVGMSTSKALAFHWEKMLWDLEAGESLFVQARVATVGATTSSNNLFGNSDSTVPGFGVVQYGPTHSTSAGRLNFNFRTTTSGGSSTQIQPLIVTGATVTNMVLQTDTYNNISIFVDGATRKLSVWVNGQQGQNPGQVLATGSTVATTAQRNFGLGHIPVDDTFVTAAAKAARFEAFRMAVLPAGLSFINPGFLDLQFNFNPRVMFKDTDYIGGA